MPEVPPKPPPLPVSAANASTFSAIRTYVSCGGEVSVAAVRTFVFWRAHSGQRMPTGVDVMQSGQIGRPQFEHDTPVSRLGVAIAGASSSYRSPARPPSGR